MVNQNDYVQNTFVILGQRQKILVLMLTRLTLFFPSLLWQPSFFLLLLFQENGGGGGEVQGQEKSINSDELTCQGSNSMRKTIQGGNSL